MQSFIEKYENNYEKEIENVYFILLKFNKIILKNIDNIKQNYKNDLIKLLEKSNQIKSKILIEKNKRDEENEKYEYFKEKILEKNKAKITELGNNESNCFIYYIFLLMEKDQKNYNIFYDFIDKLIDFIYKSSLYNISNKTKKINIYVLYILSKMTEFFGYNHNNSIVRNNNKKSFDVQVIII